MDRALHVVGCFNDGDTALSLRELSERTGLYKSTILRLAASLEAGGYLRRLSDKSFVLGPEVMRLGALYQKSFRLEGHVRPILQRLVRDAGESASFYRREGSTRICLFREDSSHDIREHIGEGDVFPLRKGASGRVLIAFSSHDRDTVLMRQLPTVSFGERDPDSAAMAVPVFSGPRTLAGAISLSGPIMRFTPERVAKMSPILIAAGRDLSAALGCPWDWGRAPNGRHISQSLITDKGG